MTISIHIHTNLLFFSTFDYIAQCDCNVGVSLCANCLSQHLTTVSPAVAHVTLLDYPVGTSARKKPYESCRRKFTVGFPVVSFPLKSVMHDCRRCYSTCGNDLLRAGRSGNRVPVGGRGFSHPSTTALRPIQLPTQWVPGLSRE
jgi:hypothetical protein